MSFFNRKKERRFLAEPPVESKAYLKNPSCGWYQIYSFRLEEGIDFEELYWCLNKEERLALIFVQIGAFRTVPLSAEAQERFTKILAFFVKHGKEIILRVAYDNQGNGISAEPDFLAEIEEHMKSIGLCIRPFAQSILVVQGLFIGSWGEMHDSKFLTPEKLKRLAKTWRQALGAEIPIAVRTPSQWRMLHLPEENAYQSKIGLFDDGMFGSVSHLGTYGDKPRQEAEWEERWCPADERSFVREIADAVPYGGEALAGEEENAKEYSETINLLNELRETGVSYLNRIHDAGRIREWQEYLCQETDLFFSGMQAGKVWQGVSLYDYIGAHLGYRYVVREAVFAEKREPHFQITIENTGFAPCTKELELYLIAVESREKKETAGYSSLLKKWEQGVLSGSCCLVSCDLRKLRQGAVVSLEVPLPELKKGTYQMFLALRQKQDKQIVLFGNEPVGKQVFLGLFSNGE